MKFTKRESGSGNNSQSHLFLKLKSGESVTGILRGEVYEYHAKWENGKSIVVSKEDSSGRSRFRVNLVVNENGNYIPKIWEFGVGINNKLAEIASLLSDVDREITKTPIKILRSGIGMDTEYNIQPLAKQTLSKSQLENIEALKLNLLEHQEKEESKHNNLPPSYLDEAPIDEEIGF